MPSPTAGGCPPRRCGCGTPPSAAGATTGWSPASAGSDGSSRSTTWTTRAGWGGPGPPSSPACARRWMPRSGCGASTASGSCWPRSRRWMASRCGRSAAGTPWRSSRSCPGPRAGGASPCPGRTSTSWWPCWPRCTAWTRRRSGCRAGTWGCPGAVTWRPPCASWAGPGPAAARSPSRPGRCWPEPPGRCAAGWTPWTSGPAATETGDELRRYTELTGRPADPAALELYRLRWALDDLSCFVRDLRAPHRRTPGTEHAWQALETTVAQLTG